MPQNTTINPIEAYNKQIKRGDYKPDNLPPCVRCNTNSIHFKLHAFRERIFWVLSELIIRRGKCILVRFRCPVCRKTYTNYPEFAVPHKRYVVPIILQTAKSYVEKDDSTYQTATEIDEESRATPEDPSGRLLSPASVHRWISMLGRFYSFGIKALDLILQENPASSLHRDLASLKISTSKTRSPERENLLMKCRKFLKIEQEFKIVFHSSIFTKFGINRGYK